MKARSKKILKIGGISLLSLLGLLIIGICAVLYIVFTPARLTPIVRQIAEKYVEAEVQIGAVEPTLFSTFPYLGVEISDIAVINPADGAASDTVAGIRHIV
ncbi:MAG: AsmA family protein, partial [Paludibacteraceae bacterium]|nr:AsmA family protein [Paludibacteraceae bacterium]